MLNLARRCVVMLCVVVLGGVCQPGQAAEPARGSLVIIGGALRVDNAEVWDRIVALAGGKGARIAVFGSAAGNPANAGKKNVERLKRSGANAFFVPVALKLAGLDARAAANDPAIAEQVRGAGGAFFAGGDQSRITAALRRSDGSNSLVLDALWDMYRRGGVIAGTSAGAAIMSSTMFVNADSVLATLQRGVADGAGLGPGLGFIGSDVFVDQHLLVRGRFARMLPAMVAKQYQLGLGIDENTAVVVYPGRDIEVVGYKGALLLDLTRATSGDGPFNISNARISYLDRSDRYNLVSGVYAPSSDKAEGKLDPAAPELRGRLFYPDILGNATVVQLMANLVGSDQGDAIGIAWNAAAPEPGLGFEFRFMRGADSIGYESASSDSVTVLNLRLDVRPITLRQPFYEYRGPAKGR